LCREEALDLASKFKELSLTNINLVGIIKEVAPIGAATDAELGVQDFQEDYFLNYPVYIDLDKIFYKALGNKSILSQKLHSWNPFKLYSDFRKLTNRIKSKKISGNLVGEGLIKGGILVVSKTNGIIYQHAEETGSLLPIADIEKALKNV
jgi:hypothetical protein